MLKSSLLLVLCVLLLSSGACGDGERELANVEPSRPGVRLLGMAVSSAPAIGALQVAALLPLAAAVGALAQLR